ncbi:MAG: diguanylate cyclase [Rhodospirillales bacterium]|jgi:diguanylate cyclase (GGDEF)-like protein|nr:diguanylate cyclase [Rhodospirillales bacterium]
MDKILIVEDANFFSKILSTSINKKLGLPVIVAKSMAEAKSHIANHGRDIVLSLLDLNLPDAPNGEIVDYVHSQAIPSIVFTSLLDDDMRETIIAKNVIDYVLKDNPSSVDYLTSLVKRIINNRSLTALVVDDSSTSRKLYHKFLTNYQFRVLEASDGEEALKIIHDSKTTTGNAISLIITDFSMPNMDGCELIREIRKDYSKDKMVIIGVSASGNNKLSSKFIKTGANDFLSKPFFPEELLCRVSQNIDNMEHLLALEKLASYDYLTGLGNRRLFFDQATPLLASAKRKETDIALAMLDIDHFKSINDTYGHDIGDVVLKALGETLTSALRATDVVARMGGEEFVIITPDISADKLPEFLDKIRVRISELSFEAEGKSFSITASFGAINYPVDNLEEMIRLADEALYESKNSGRDRVTITGTA